MDIQEQKTLARIKKIHENFVVTLGAVIGVTLVAYFFTFAMLTDTGNDTWLWFEGISSIAMLVVLVKIKGVALGIMRLCLSRNPTYQRCMENLTAKDL